MSVYIRVINIFPNLIIGQRGILVVNVSLVGFSVIPKTLLMLPSALTLSPGSV